jgi:hypothetical protein
MFFDAAPDLAEAIGGTNGVGVGINCGVAIAVSICDVALFAVVTIGVGFL